MKKTILPCLLIAGLAAPGLSQKWTAVDTVVQSSMAELNAQTLLQYLNSETYMASIQPGLVCGHRLDSVLSSLRHGEPPAAADAEKLDPRLIYAHSSALSATTIAISVVAADEKQAVAAAEEILGALDNLRPQSAENAKMTLELALQDQSQAMQTLEQKRKELESLLGECQGMDPERWIQVLTPRMERHLHEMWDGSLDMAVQKAMREHLAAKLEKIPQFKEVRFQDVPNPEYNDLRQKQTMAQTELSILRERSRRGRDEEVNSKIEELSREISRLEGLLAATTKCVEGPPKRIPNPDHQNVTHQLMEVEQKLAQLSARHGALEEAIQKLRGDVVRYQGLAARKSATEEELSLARNRLNEAEKRVERARNGAIHTRDAGMRRVCGPTVVRLR